MEVIDRITDLWFLTEPALFGAFCTHKLVENKHLDCPVRVGEGRIEYNPYLLMGMPRQAVEELFRIEMIRILLLHPYSRKPEGCSPGAVLWGSDMAIATNCPIPRLVSPSMMGLPDGECFEWYAWALQSEPPRSPDSGKGDGGIDSAGEGKDGEASRGKGKMGSGECDYTGAKDATELWQEDAWMAEEVKNVADVLSSWGSLPGSLVEQILAGLKPRLDYRKVLSGFRSSILCSKRRLTRMRPNRRSGFQYMGSIRQLRTNYLVAVDVSGSISDDDLKFFFSTINRFFKYGVEKIDALTFDTSLGEPVTLTRAKAEFKVKGRGGTYFQPVVDYMAEHSEYDGLIIFTDGYAPKPEVPARLKGRLLWILRSEKEYSEHRKWMSESGRVCFIENH